MKNLVVIIDKSTGNHEVGEMWQETKIFPANTTLEDVMKWAIENTHSNTKEHSRARYTLTLPHEYGKSDDD